ncbi:MAG: aminodeoxychorismate lyase [Candidatus Omnitrophica bacterium]|nr:aminodeoxychorismate lyase [Candidatus Omnitrophota bacterium]
MKVWLNSKIIDANTAKVSIFDRGFLYGDGVFETMRGYGSSVFKIDEHLDRLYGSLKRIGIKIPYSKTLLKKQISRLIKINRLADAYVRVTATRGEGRIGFAAISLKRSTVIIAVNPFTPYPKKMYQKGVSLKITKIRQNENSPLSGIKSTSFLNYILSRMSAKTAGFDDALLLNSEGRIAEAAISNIFMVKGKYLITPPVKDGILPGITRSTILKIAWPIGLKPKQVSILPEQLYSADEVFLTNSLMEVMPVVKINSRKIGSGKPGIFTKMFHSAYRICARSSIG